MSDFKNIQDFRKSKLSRHQYQDPTYLSFLLLFDFTDGVNSPLLSKPAETFLENLGDPYAERLEALQNFKKALKTINNEMPWYWQSLSGLERVQQYNPENAYFGGDDAELTIGTLESINLTVAGLMHLYRKAVFDETKWTYILPANLRRFRMYVYVTEVRTIKNLSEPKIGGLNSNPISTQSLSVCFNSIKWLDFSHSSLNSVILCLNESLILIQSILVVLPIIVVGTIKLSSLISS